MIGKIFYIDSLCYIWHRNSRKQIFDEIFDIKTLRTCTCFIHLIFTVKMSGGCVDLRKRWDHLVGKTEQEAVQTIKRDGRKY